LTSRCLLVREAPRRPEVYDHLVLASLRVWDPRRSASGQVDFSEVREDLGALVQRFPRLEKIFVDEAAEAGSLIPWAKAQPTLTLKMHGFVATPASNMELWGALVARLHAQTLAIPRHERLIAELRNLRQESFAFGGKWRIIDAGRKYHRDVSLALAGACHAAGYRGYPAIAGTAASFAKDDDERAAAAAPSGSGFFGGRRSMTLAAAEERRRGAVADPDHEPPGEVLAFMIFEAWEAACQLAYVAPSTSGPDYTTICRWRSRPVGQRSAWATR
jgi:hypothetical protein